MPQDRDLVVSLFNILYVLERGKATVHRSRSIQNMVSYWCASKVKVRKKHHDISWLISWHCLQPETWKKPCPAVVTQKSPGFSHVGAPSILGNWATPGSQRLPVLGMVHHWSAMTALMLANLALLPVASGKLISAAVVPHGDFAYDPKLVNDTGRNVAALLECLAWDREVSWLFGDIFAECEWMELNRLVASDLRVELTAQTS